MLKIAIFTLLALLPAPLRNYDNMPELMQTAWAATLMRPLEGNNGHATLAVDNFTFTRLTEITAIHSYDVEFFTPQRLSAEIYIYRNSKGKPGELIARGNSENDATKPFYIDTGWNSWYWHIPIYRSSVVLTEPIELEAGTYWIGMRTVVSDTAGKVSTLFTDKENDNQKAWWSLNVDEYGTAQVPFRELYWYPRSIALEIEIRR